LILVLKPEPARPVTTTVSGLDTSVVGFEFELLEGLVWAIAEELISAAKIQVWITV